MVKLEIQILQHMPWKVHNWLLCIIVGISKYIQPEYCKVLCFIFIEDLLLFDLVIVGGRCKSKLMKNM